MTYNFDPDKWYENEIAFLEKNYKSGKISEQEYKTSLEELSEINGTSYIPFVKQNIFDVNTVY